MPRGEQPPQPRRRNTAAGVPPEDAIVGVVQDLLESGGYDAVQLREVARRARVSLATIYRLFPTREALIVTAVERWMAAHGHRQPAPPPPGESLYDGLMRLFRHVFEPWERSPRMLEAYHRAGTGPGGDRLHRQGWSTIEPAARAVMSGADPSYAADIAIILTNMSHALTDRFANGTLDITEILPALERAVYRLTSDNAEAATASVVRRAQQHAVDGDTAPPRKP